MPDLPGAAMTARYYVVKHGAGYAIVDSRSPCRQKVGLYRDEEAAQNFANDMNTAWRKATEER